MSDRKPTAAFWMTMLLVSALLLYLLSFGPACWIASHADVGVEWLPVVYRPITLIWENSPDVVSVVIASYAHFGRADGWGWVEERDAEHFGGRVWRFKKFDFEYLPTENPAT